MAYERCYGHISMLADPSVVSPACLDEADLCAYMLPVCSGCTSLKPLAAGSRRLATRFRLSGEA